jgi:hypothetical protein
MELGRRLQVARYDVPLTPNRETGEIHVLETMLPSIEPGTLDRLAMKAFPLWTPEAEPVALARLDGYRWHFDPEHRQPGPWLITGWDGHWSRVRPLCWSVDGGDDETVGDALSHPTAARSITHVVRLLDREARRKACDACIADLAATPLHQDWSTVMAYVGALPSLPATTFDLIVSLAQCPDAAALALVRSTQATFELVWQSLERLPFSWLFVPVSAWLGAAKRYATALRDALQLVVADLGGDVDALVLPALTTFLAEASLHLPGLQCVVELIWEQVFHRPRQQSQYLHLACSEAGREALRSMVLPEAEQSLLQMHTQEHWPRCGDLEDWLACQSGVPLSLTALWYSPPPGARFRAPVLNAPVLAALASACNIQVSRDVVFHVRRLRDFDVAWFDAAYGCMLALALGYLLEHEKGFLA